MKTSDMVQLKRDITTALDAAGRKEMGWYVFVEKLDELGYDIVQRPPVTKPLQTSSVDWIEPPRVQTDFDGAYNDTSRALPKDQDGLNDLVNRGARTFGMPSPC